MKLEKSSSASSLIANGKSAHVVNPWSLIIDTDEETITVSKRNRFLIGKDTQILAFKFIRSITIDEHLIGADIHIKVVGGNASVFCFSKSDVDEIKEILLEYNQTKKGRGILFS
ncbi:MAG: hypothetical protein ACKO7P_09145 [Bacteroidota bacterium]